MTRTKSNKMTKETGIPFAIILEADFLKIPCAGTPLADRSYCSSAQKKYKWVFTFPCAEIETPIVELLRIMSVVNHVIPPYRMLCGGVAKDPIADCLMTKSELLLDRQ